MAACWVAGAAAAQLAASEAAVPYRVEFQGVANEKLLAGLQAASDLVTLRDKPPASAGLLERRAQRDRDRLIQTLEALGYYDAEIACDIDGAARPARVTLKISPGAIYRLAQVRIQSAEGQPPLQDPLPQGPLPQGPLPDAAALGMKLDQPVLAQGVLDAEKRLVQILKKRGFPFPKVTRRTVELNREKKTATVTFHIAPGPPGRFGPTTFTGVRTVAEDFLRRKIPWKEGGPFNGDLVEKLRQNLVGTGLFALVEIVCEQDSDGLTPVKVEVAERKPRTVSAGLSFRTDEALGATAEWEHRNLKGRAERLQLKSRVSTIGYNAEGTYTVPDFRRLDQALVLRLRVAEDQPDAFSSSNVSTSATVERKCFDTAKAGLGIAFKTDQVKQFGHADTFGLLSIPAYLTREHVNDPIEPIRGERLSLKLTPFADLFANHVTFVKAEAGYSRFANVLDTPLIILAGRIRVGSILGAERGAIPADERFYAGGGDSVRGYRYQSAGPLHGKDPIGGRSLIELSGELRIRVAERIDLVGFLDAGAACRAETPNLGQMHSGAGLGVGYYSKIGPIRFDVAVPLDRRSGVDDAFQMYISLGHGF